MILFLPPCPQCAAQINNLTHILSSKKAPSLSLFPSMRDMDRKRRTFSNLFTLSSFAASNFFIILVSEIGRGGPPRPAALIPHAAVLVHFLHFKARLHYVVSIFWTVINFRQLVRTIQDNIRRDLYTSGGKTRFVLGGSNPFLLK